MYNKLFTKIIHSSIWLSPDPQRIAWITFLALMDQDGFVNLASPANLAHTARITVEEAQEAVLAFESPDPHDLSQEYEGRRIERVPSGWMVLNALKYRDLATREIQRDQTRKRVSEHRAKKRAVTPSNDGVTTSNESVTPSDSYSHPTPTPTPTTGHKKVEARTSARATRLPVDFGLTEERRKVCEAENLEAERTLENFRDYWTAASGAKARKVDWDATWRIWCRSEYQKGKPGTKVKAKSRTADEMEADYRARGIDPWTGEKLNASG